MVLTFWATKKKIHRLKKIFLNLWIIIITSYQFFRFVQRRSFTIKQCDVTMKKNSNEKIAMKKIWSFFLSKVLASCVIGFKVFHFKVEIMNEKLTNFNRCKLYYKVIVINQKKGEECCIVIPIIFHISLNIFHLVWTWMWKKSSRG